MQKQKTQNLPKFIMTMVIILFLGTLFGVVSYYLTKGNVVDNQLEIQQADSEKLLDDKIFNNSKDNNIENESDISDWKTYRNEAYGFEVDYPLNWKFHKFSTNSIVNITSYDYNDPRFNDGDENGVTIEIEAESYDQKMTLGSLVSNKLLPINDEYINGISFLSLNGYDTIEFGLYTNRSYYLLNQDGKTRIDIIIRKGKNENLNLISDQILSTFKFIEKEMVDTEIVLKIVNELSDTGQLRQAKVDDLNNDGLPEIIVVDGYNNENIYNLYVVTIVDDKGDYKSIGKLKLPSIGGGWIFGKSIDINNDGIREIFLEPEMRGGTGNRHFYFIAYLDLKTLKIELIKVVDSNNKIVDNFEFHGGGEVGRCNYSGWVFGKDFNNNGKKEIIRLNASTSQDSSACSVNPKIEYKDLCRNCELSIFEWDGLNFVYNDTFKKLVKNNINTGEFQGIGCDRCEWKE